METKCIYEAFSKIYKKIDEYYQSISQNKWDKDIDNLVKKILNELSNFINENIKNLNLVWLNFFNSDMSKYWFSNFDQGVISFKDFVDIDRNEYFNGLKASDGKECGQCILFAFEQEYKDHILSSSDLLQLHNMAGEVFMLKKPTDNDNNINDEKIIAYLDDSLKETKKVDGGVTYNKLQYIDVNIRDDTPKENIQLSSEDKTKYLKWKFWVNSYAPQSQFTHIFYIDSLKTKSNKDSNDEILKNFNPVRVNFAIRIPHNVKTDYYNCLNIFISQIRNLINHISELYLFEVYHKAMRKESIKSAIAAIMSRNMSHNLGSHILFYIKEHLKTVKTIFKYNVLAELINVTIAETDWDDNSFSLKQKIKDCLEHEQNKDELPFLVGLGHFISYLQERQDYIATICTDYIPYFSTVDFKRAIYDELTPDACHARHHDNRKGEKTENLLLKYIAKSEGFGRKIEGEGNNIKYGEHNIIVKFGTLDGLDFDGLKDNTVLTTMRQLKLSLPSGYTGRQAFFSIFENIIRNAAKHGTLQSSSNNLEFTIQVLEKSDIDGETDPFWDAYKNAADIGDLYIIKIADNCVITKDAESRLQENLKDDYTDGSGKLKETNKGLKEMRISATWLRNESYINPDLSKAPILRVHKNQNNNLEYVFCVQRPKRIAFVVSRNTGKLENVQNLLQKHYCKLFSDDKFIKDTKLNYDFVVCEDNIYNNILPHSHSFIVKKEKNDDLLQSLKKSNSANIKNGINEIAEKIYEKLLGINGSQIDKICISDKDVKNITDKYEEDKKAVIQEYVNIIDGYSMTENYIYKTHFESIKEFSSFMKKNFNRIGQIEFVEGITGHNSTARLLRTETIDKLWYYKHLNAMKTKVAVFDERFFDRYTKIPHKDLVTEGWWTEIINQKNKDIATIKKEITDINKDKIITGGNYFEFQSLSAIDSLISFMNQYANYRDEFETEELSPYLYKLKGVEFFNIVRRGEKFVIVGYSDVTHSLENTEAGYKYSNSIYKVIGTIYEDNKKEVKVEFTGDYKTKFDFISIHQGLLDKIYAQFNIQKAVLEDRAKITKEIHRNFSNTMPVRDENNKYDYLPKFIIHSGRSKPSNDDMPQHQPFVQFSALENVIADCKYSLVELLNMAHYE